jgi:hypothetical protein
MRGARIALSVVALAACTKDLSSQPIVAQSQSPSPPPRAAATPPGPPWRAELCRPAGDATTGTLAFSGECSFAVAEPALCRPEEDDFYILVKRTLAGGRAFNFYVNVERHHGPGEYLGHAQIHVTVRDGQALYRWSNFTGSITLAGDTATSANETHATLRGMRLDPEPGTLARGSIIVDGTLACVQSNEPPAQ